MQNVPKQRVKKSDPRVQSKRRAVNEFDLRKAANDLHDCEGRYRAVVEQSFAAIYMIQNQRIVYWNPRMREIFGYAPGDAVDRNPLAHVKKADWLKVNDQIQRHLTDGGDVAYTITALRKDGSEFLLEIHAARVVYKDNPAIIAVAQDITDKVRASEDTRHHLQRLRQAQRATVDVIRTMSELRDPYTNLHQQRVGEIAVAAAIAFEMGLDEDRVEGIRTAGFLHDVGKIGVPAEILSKPSKLTSAEYELVKAHVQYSYEILKGIEFPWPVARVALQHHERLDGSGYPNGLKGAAIILESRIVAVADVIEAMASHRPYRVGLGIEIALAEIERGCGTRYDTDTVTACLHLFRDKGYTISA